MSLPISRRGLYWFHNDFRLTDNPLLQAAAEQVDEMLCVCSPPQMTHFLSRFSQQCQLGASREAFWSQSAIDLAASLAKLGQSLYCLPDLSAASLAALIREQGITHLYCQRFAGIDEQRVVDALQATCPDLNIIQRESGRILDESELPFSLAELPATFSRFRKRVEPLAVPGPLPAVETLPSVIEVDYPLVTTSPCQSGQFLGGESAALAHCDDYFSTSNASHYKATRNGLDGMAYSTKFSPWLAQGCLSARTILAKLAQYESAHGSNESTYWIAFELLWRDYFYWYARLHRQRLFAFRGITDQALLTSFYPERFAAWIAGETPYAIVNACMKQLRATGYMSNRGRQLVASCLVHELGMDWRYGAAYFETQLVDYDVASNWGNWQYLAGVGADPRSGRQFNLEKQTQTYDPDGEFIRRWQGTPFHSCLDAFDYNGWPIEDCGEAR